MFFTWLICIQLPVLGQILDDSTAEIYSSRTVKFRTENQMVTGFGYQYADSSLNHFSQKGDFLYQESGWYQNLGVFGSASRPLFHRLPSAIGLRNGQNMFDYLIPNRDEIKYYNTLSPHSDIQYFQGARQRAMLRATISQNILPGLNITAHYQRLTAMRTINVTQAEERLTDHHSAYVSAHYSDSLGRYRAWGHYQHLNHLQYETGGIAFTNDRQGYKDSLFVNPEIYPASLNNNARNRDLRNHWYFSQIWRPKLGGIYFRTSHYRFRQLNRYTDPLPQIGFYGVDNLYFQSPIRGENQPVDTLFSERIFRLWENTGYVGFQNQHIDVSFYVRHRDSRFFNNLFNFLQHKQEVLLGAHVAGRLGPGQMWAKAEWIGPREFDVQSTWEWAGLKASGRLVSYQPSMVQREFVSKNLFYVSDFSSSHALQVQVQQKFTWRKWQFLPSFEHQSILDGIVFSADFEPIQKSGTATMQWLNLRVKGQLGKRIFTDNQLIRTFQSGVRVSQMPTYAYHSMHWVELFQKKKGYGIQVGLSVDWRYDWPSESFHPLSGQWFLTDNQKVDPYTLVDFFAHFRMNKTRIYAKVHNTFQGLGSKGYFATPLYQAQRRLFEIGLVWYFFD